MSAVRQCVLLVPNGDVGEEGRKVKVEGGRNGNGSDLDRIMHNPTPTLQEVGF